MGRAAVVVPNMAARLVAVEDSLEMVAQEVLEGIPAATSCFSTSCVAARIFLRERSG